MNLNPGWAAVNHMNRRTEPAMSDTVEWDDATCPGCGNKLKKCSCPV